MYPRLQQALLIVGLAMVAGCQRNETAEPLPSKDSQRSTTQSTSGAPTSPTLAADDVSAQLQLRVPAASRKALDVAKLRTARRDMVNRQIAGRGVKDERVLEAMRQVPRHEFIPRGNRPYAYYDSPLPIGREQTISQPYIVALMSELLRPKPDDRILEIGTGSGYQAAVLGVLVKEVYTIEIVEPLAKRAQRDLQRLGYSNVHARHGDGYKGWPDQAPFDGVIVTAAPEKIPKPLLEQLKEGGRLVIPVGPSRNQELVVIHKTDRGPFRESIIPVRFVPMTGEVRKQDE